MILINLRVADVITQRDPKVSLFPFWTLIFLRCMYYDLVLKNASESCSKYNLICFFLKLNLYLVIGSHGQLWIYCVQIFKIVLAYCRVLPPTESFLILVCSSSVDFPPIYSLYINISSTTAAISELSIHNTMVPVLKPSPSKGEGKTCDIKVVLW